MLNLIIKEMKNFVTYIMVEYIKKIEYKNNKKDVIEKQNFIYSILLDVHWVVAQ